MKVIGVELHRASFAGVTSAAGIAVVLWLIVLATPLSPTSALSKASILLATFMGCLSSEVGIQVSRGWRHLVVNVAGCVLALIIFRSVAWLLL